MNRKSEQNKNIYKEDNSYQALLKVERICRKQRKELYNKDELNEAIKIIKNILTWEEK